MTDLGLHEEMSLGRDGIAGLILSRDQPGPVRPVASACRTCRSCRSGRASIRRIVLAFMAARERAAGHRRTGVKRRAAGSGAGGTPRRTIALVVLAVRHRRRLRRRCCRSSAFASPRCSSSPRCRPRSSRPRTARQWAVLAAIALGTAAVTYFVVRTTTCWCCCRAAPGRASDDARAARPRPRQRSRSGNTCCRCSLGTLVGVVGGALPGVTITMTIIVVLPFTFGLDPLQGLAAMTGVYVGGSAGGLITACLLGIPGTPSAIATTFDGFPMARNGEPGRAIWLGVWASFFGGLLGGAVPDRSSPGRSRRSRSNSARGSSSRCSCSRWRWSRASSNRSLLKGLISTALGLLITVIGTRPDHGQVPRFTFGSEFIGGGFPFLPVLIGIFAFAQIMTDRREARPADAARRRTLTELQARALVARQGDLGDPRRGRSCCCGRRSSALLIGVLPAIGGSAAEHAWPTTRRRRFSQAPGALRHRHARGHHRLGILEQRQCRRLAGDHHGVRHSRRRGHRGDARRDDDPRHPVRAAVHLAEPDSSPTASIAAYILAHPLHAADLLGSARADAAHHHACRMAVLFPVVLVLCVIGAYALNNTMQSVYVLLLFGVARLRAGEARLSARAVDPRRDPRRPDRDQPGARDHDRLESLAVPHPADFRRAAARGRCSRSRSPSGSICATRRVPKRRRSRTSGVCWLVPSRSQDREKSGSAHGPCAADGSVCREGR